MTESLTVEETAKGSRRPKRFRWYHIMGIVGGALLVVLFLVGWLLQSRMETILIREINRQLVVRVEAESISISLLRSFPRARLRFNQVRIPTQSEPEKPLLEAASVFVDFSMLDMLRKRYTIRYLAIRDGRLHVMVDEEGLANYNIFKPSDDEEPSKGASFALRKFRIRDVEVMYENRQDNMLAELVSSHTIFRGDFSADLYRMRLGGGVVLRQLVTGGQRFFTGQTARLDLALDIDKLTNTYTIERGKLEMEGLPLLVSGTIRHSDQIRELALKVDGDNMKIAHLLNLLPTQGESITKEYAPTGNVSFRGTIQGGYAGGESPLAEFTYGIDQGAVRHKASGVDLHKISTKGVYRLSARENLLILNTFSANLGNGTIQGSGRVANPSSPELMVDLEAVVQVEELLGFFPLKEVEKASGRLLLFLKAETALKLSEEFTITHLLNSRTNGELQMEGVSFVLADGGRAFQELSGRMVFDNNDVRVTRLAGQTGSNELVFDGYFRNLFPYLLVDNQPLEFRGSVRTPVLDLKELFLAERDGGNGQGQFSLPDRISGSLQVTADRLIYGGFTPSRVMGRVQVSPYMMTAEQVQMDAFGGKLQGAVALAATGDGDFHFDCMLNTDRTNIRELFRQFNDFGQQSFTHEHLDGLLTSRIRIQSDLDPRLTMKLPTMEVVGELLIEHGELKHYEPVMAMARYTRLDDLSHIRFSALRNEIRIRNQEIVIPEMMIRSDALDLSFSGVHHFQGQISYRIRVLLSELLSRKARRVNPEAVAGDASDQDHRGRVTLHLLVEGTSSHPVVRYDRRSRRQTVQESLRTETQEVRELLRKEFGTFNREKRSNERQHARKQEEEGQIIIEWEDQ